MIARKKTADGLFRPLAT